MARPYSRDLRERVLAVVERDGESCRAAAAQFEVSVSTAIRWVAQYRRTGSVAAMRMGGRRPKLIVGADKDGLVGRCRSGPFTLRGLVLELAERGLQVDYRTVWSFVHAAGLSFKKTVLAGEQDRPDIARRRSQWRRYQTRIDPARLVFIDETWTKTNMAPLRGWGPRGERLRAKVPYGHWNTMTFIAALRCNRIEAPWLLDCPINADRFRIYVEKLLGPTLRPGDMVIADNLSSHKRADIRAVIRAAGAKFFLLPKYSPDLNPIEQVFAKLKHLLRKAAARTQTDLIGAVGELLRTFTPAECAH
ncbi:MAG: IS630 family transposase, partial [Planctomycetaceae bacterium]|nr:IS630 family transposase [Planctomycetaceae bacterium]